MKAFRVTFPENHSSIYIAPTPSKARYLAFLDCDQYFPLISIKVKRSKHYDQYSGFFTRFGGHLRMDLKKDELKKYLQDQSEKGYI